MTVFSHLAIPEQWQWITTWLSQSISWRNAAIALALLNLKSLPFAWHARVFYYMFKHFNLRRQNIEDPKFWQERKSQGHSSHPLFAPVTVMSHTSLLEMDYNLHKSNSTYFADLDISRTALVTNLVTPGMEITKRELDREVDEKGKKKFPGRLAVMLGSVYCSFKKEIPPYERYEMQSKIAGWDDKWLYVLTFFLRPEKRKGQGKTILAMGISQYVLKKGRFTVRPSRVLRASGFLPERPEGATPAVSGTPAGLDTPQSGDGINASEGLDEFVTREVMSFTENADLDQAMLENKKREKSWDRMHWTWERIEQERLRGLDIVKSFVGVDGKLRDEAWLD